VKRRVSSLTLVVSPVRRAYINLAGCNFDCRACFAVAKGAVGQKFSVEELLDFFVKVCKRIFGGIANEVAITGGEPTLDFDYMLALLRELKKLGASRVELSTNGYLLGQNDRLMQLKDEGIDLIKIDLKAHTDSIHRWYTGQSNSNVLKAIKLLRELNLNFRVRTIFIPGIVDLSEIEKIACFLGGINSDIPYRIYQFAPRRTKISRVPTRDEMLKALDIAKRYLNNVEVLLDIISYRHDWVSVEICADSLVETFQEIAEESARAVEGWGDKYRVISMSQVLAGEAGKY